MLASQLSRRLLEKARARAVGTAAHEDVTQFTDGTRDFVSIMNTPRLSEEQLRPQHPLRRRPRVSQEKRFSHPEESVRPFVWH